MLTYLIVHTPSSVNEARSYFVGQVCHVCDHYRNSVWECTGFTDKRLNDRHERLCQCRTFMPKDTQAKLEAGKRHMDYLQNKWKVEEPQ